LVEQVTVNHRVGGSSPSSGACTTPYDSSALRPSQRRAVFSLLPANAFPNALRARDRGWSLGNGIAVGALIVSGVFGVLLFRLQRAQNQMVGRHERERRELEDQLRTRQTQATDRRIGWIAFKLARQLQTWFDEPIPESGGRLPHEMITGIRGATTPNLSHLGLLSRWAAIRCRPAELRPAEERAETLIDNAAAASEAVGATAVTAFRTFHEAIGHLNRGLIDMEEGNWAAAQHRFVNGYDVLAYCLERVTELIPDALKDQLVFLRGIPSTLRTYAPTVSTEPPPSTDASPA
jgi:hypothetical protein